MTKHIIDDRLLHSLRSCVSAAPRAVAGELSRFVTLVEVEDFDMAMVRVRRALELIVRTACAVSKIDAGTRSVEGLIADLAKAGVLPPVIERHCRVAKEFGNLGAHPLKAIPDEVDTLDSGLSVVEAELCARSLCVVASWYFSHVVPRLQDRFSFRILEPTEIGLTELSQAAAIDVEVYPAEFRGKPDVLLTWHHRNKDVFTMVADIGTHRVVGCLTVIPLEEEVYQRIEAGFLIDVDLSSESIQEFDLPDFYKLYVASIVVHPSYHGTVVFSLLYEAYLAKLLDLARREIYATELLADAITKDGERLAQFVGMKTVGPSQHRSTIYKLVLLPPSFRVTTKMGKQLLSFYQSKYEEFKDLLSVSSTAIPSDKDAGNSGPS